MDAIMKITDEKIYTLFGIPLGIMQNFMQSVKQGFILRKKDCVEKYLIQCIGETFYS